MNFCPCQAIHTRGEPCHHPLVIGRPPTWRSSLTRLLGFARVQVNSLYAVNSRGTTESYILSVVTKIVMTLGRLANEMIWFTTPEFNYFHLPVEFTTGSSIMPQKRNPDIFEIVRSNVNVIVALQTQVKDISKNQEGTPERIEYEKDQEEKRRIEQEEIDLRGEDK